MNAVPEVTSWLRGSPRAAESARQEGGAEKSAGCGVWTREASGHVRPPGQALHSKGFSLPSNTFSARAPAGSGKGRPSTARLGMRPRACTPRPPSSQVALILIALGWMMCPGCHPARPRRSCLFKKIAIQSPRRQQPVYQGSDASCRFPPARDRPSDPRPSSTFTLPGESSSQRVGRSSLPPPRNSGQGPERPATAARNRPGRREMQFNLPQGFLGEVRA
jgi:hypothetical protein